MTEYNKAPHGLLTRRMGRDDTESVMNSKKPLPSMIWFLIN